MSRTRAGCCRRSAESDRLSGSARPRCDCSRGPGPDDEHVVQADPRLVLGAKARDHMPKREERGGTRSGSTSRNGGGLAGGLLSFARAPAQRSGGNRESSSSMNVGMSGTACARAWSAARPIECADMTSTGQSRSSASSSSIVARSRRVAPGRNSTRRSMSECGPASPLATDPKTRTPSVPLCRATISRIAGANRRRSSSDVG